MRRAKKKAKPVDHLAQPVAIETFRDVGPYEMSSLRQDQPTCFNGIVRVHRYRVTFERIDEPDEVIRDRILKLWLESATSSTSISRSTCTRVSQRQGGVL